MHALCTASTITSYTTGVKEKASVLCTLNRCREGKH